MVCLGNICRSPMAAAVLHNKAITRQVEVTVTSGGTADYHVGEGPHPMSARVWSDAGYRYEHVARQFTASMFAQTDLVLVMDESNLTAVRRLAATPEDAAKIRYLRSYDPQVAAVDPQGPQRHRLEVPDPWGGPRSDYQAVLEMVERSVEGLLDTVV